MVTTVLDGEVDGSKQSQTTALYCYLGIVIMQAIGWILCYNTKNDMRREQFEKTGLLNNSDNIEESAIIS